MIGSTNAGGGSGGSGLSLRVLGGTTQPTSPREGTIWVNTSAEKPDYIISESQPGSPASGLAWIKLGSDGVSLPVDKKGTLAITLAGCAVWSGSIWDNVDAWAYTGGKWVQFSYAILYLYRDGNQYTEITGGFRNFAWLDGYSKKGTMTLLQNKIRLVDDGSSSCAVPSKRINLSKYKKLIVKKTSPYFKANNRTFLAVSGSEFVYNTADLAARMEISQVNPGEYALDISDLSGDFLVGVFQFAVPTVTYTIEFSELRLE